MTTTLLLRLAAPRQAWGEVGTERTRPTAKIPTFTGLRGLLNAALGMPRGQDSALLDELSIHVRVDRPGIPETDFHTVSPPPSDLAEVRRRARRMRVYDATSGRADYTVPIGTGQPWLVGGKPQTHISERQYLADAEFIAAFTGRSDLIATLSDAVHRTTFSPYLGRLAFAPQFPFHLGTRPGAGLEVLTALPSTVTDRDVLRVHHIGPGRPVQVARIDPPRTVNPLRDWKNLST